MKTIPISISYVPVHTDSCAIILKHSDSTSTNKEHEKRCCDVEEDLVSGKRFFDAVAEDGKDAAAVSPIIPTSYQVLQNPTLLIGVKGPPFFT